MRALSLKHRFYISLQTIINKTGFFFFENSPVEMCNSLYHNRFSLLLVLTNQSGLGPRWFHPFDWLGDYHMELLYHWDQASLGQSRIVEHWQFPSAI